jgi:CheY-like chemotaxis protein
MNRRALSGQSILVVEDEPLVAMGVREVLESAGAYVFVATRLSHALQLAGHPDLSAALVDYRLVEGNSRAICSLLEQRGIPFVFYSGYDDMRDLWPQALRVPKPAEGRRLIEALSEALGVARQSAHAA